MHEDVDEDLAVTSYATAQRPGDRAFQCDATAVCTMPDGTRAYALLDGVGDTPAVRSWTRTAARRLAHAATESADAEAGLRAEYDHYAADPARHRRPRPALRGGRRCRPRPRRPFLGRLIRRRPCLLLDGHLRLLTEDHNARRACDGGDRNLITACLGDARSDEETERLWGHPAIEYLRGPAGLAAARLRRCLRTPRGRWP
ncbi:hypothetical protein [Streptomyces sp. NRRL S-31]|uniref:hypothetical protein n=1 Tax=Streptomyces sp. NRRL S-31 TaxID=1463898 RepID=UPI0004C7BB15|nr:hypothetical protein [Streptomyces sp. NRRL S-31]